MSRNGKNLIRPVSDKKTKSNSVEAKELRMCASANRALCAYTKFLLGEKNEEVVYHWIDKVSGLGQDPKNHPLTDQDQKAWSCVNKIRAQMVAKAEDEKRFQQQILDQQRLQQMSKLLALMPPKSKKKALVKIDTAPVKVILMPPPACVKVRSTSNRSKRVPNNTPVSNNSGASTPIAS